jgi:hypothetical protein
MRWPLCLAFCKGRARLRALVPCRGRERHVTGEHCWARGAAVSPVGCALEQVRADSRAGERSEEVLAQLPLLLPSPPNAPCHATWSAARDAAFCPLFSFIPDTLRHLDTDGSWSKSGYQGWVYGDGLDLVDHHPGFSPLAPVKTASVSEKSVIDQQQEQIITTFDPATLTLDNSYTQAIRIWQWAKRGVMLLTTALRWTKGCYAKAYHRYIGWLGQVKLLRSRR